MKHLERNDDDDDDDDNNNGLFFDKFAPVSAVICCPSFRIANLDDLLCWI